MTAPLIHQGWRRPALAAIAVGLLVFLVLAIITFHGTTTSFDTWCFKELFRHVGRTRAGFLIGFTEPAMSVLILAFVAVLAVSVRRLDVAVLAVLGPVIGTALTSWVFKPAIGRDIGPGVLRGFLAGPGSPSYPSGHETGVVCTATVLLIVFGQLTLDPRVRAVLITILALWCFLAAVALVASFYHYATDTIGAAGISVAVVLALALALDRLAPAVNRWLRRTQLTPRS